MTLEPSGATPTLAARSPFELRVNLGANVPETDVRTLVAGSGGRVVHVEEEMMAGGYRSCRYWVVKA